MKDVEELLNLKIVSKIGSGKYGEVFKVSKHNSFYALKIFKGSKKDATHEYNFTKKCMGLGIGVNIYDFKKIGKNKYCFLLELLGEPLKNCVPTEEDCDKLLNLFSIMSKNKIMHCDIHSLNILKSKDGFKLIDFSFACDENNDFFSNFGYYLPPETEYYEFDPDWDTFCLFLESKKMRGVFEKYMEKKMGDKVKTKGYKFLYKGASYTI
jgi:serine/threonine protein kinase